MPGLRVLPLLLALAIATRAAHAGVTVRIDPGPGKQFADQLGIDLSSVEAQLRTELDRLFQVVRLKDYLRSFGDAQAFTTRGLGVDYAGHPKLLMVGVAANVSINAEKAFVPEDLKSRPPVGGLSTALTVMAGLNLGWLGLRPVTLFANGFKHRSTLGDFAAELENFGFHAQLKLFGPRRESSLWRLFFRWGGLDVTTGIDYARLGLSLSQGFSRDIPIGNGASALGRVNVASTGSFDIDMRTWSVPLEVTTNFRFLYVLSVYGGVGFDWQAGGGSETTVDLSGSMTGIAGSNRLNIGSAQIIATESAEPSPGRLRGILGLQANAWMLRIFAQLNFVPNPPTAGFAFGARLVW